MSLWILIWNLPPLKSTSPKQSLGTFEAHRLWQLNLQSGHGNVQTNHYSCSKWRYIVCRGGQYDDITSDGRKNIYHFILCFVVHFGIWGPLDEGALAVCRKWKVWHRTENCFSQNRSPPGVSHLSCQRQLETFGDIKIRETLHSWPRQCRTPRHCRKINMKRHAFHLTICGFLRARLRINILMCTAISRHVEKGRLSAQLVTKGHCIWYFSVK